jgi:hypothetical protein
MIEPPHQHVGQHIEARDEVELLKDHRARRPPVAQRLAAQAGHIDAVATDRSRVGFLKPVDQAQQRGFPRARRADDPDHLARRDSERNAIHGHAGAEAAGEVAKFEHPGSWHPASLRQNAAAEQASRG